MMIGKANELEAVLVEFPEDLDEAEKSVIISNKLVEYGDAEIRSAQSVADYQGRLTGVLLFITKGTQKAVAIQEVLDLKEYMKVSEERKSRLESAELIRRIASQVNRYPDHIQDIEKIGRFLFSEVKVLRPHPESDAEVGCVGKLTNFFTNYPTCLALDCDGGYYKVYPEQLAVCRTSPITRELEPYTNLVGRRVRVKSEIPGTSYCDRVGLEGIFEGINLMLPNTFIISSSEGVYNVLERQLEFLSDDLGPAEHMSVF